MALEVVSLAIVVLFLKEGTIRREFLSRSRQHMPLQSPVQFRQVGSEQEGRAHLHTLEKLTAISSIRLHWSEYLMEIGEITIYMLLTCGFATLLQHPASPVRQLIVSSFSRRISMGFAIGATVIALVVSPLGKQSGGHFNPAITLTFYRLGKVAPWDALFYMAGQFSGAIAGVAIATYIMGGAPGNRFVHYAVTAPGIYGKIGAFLGELIISFALMATILLTSNRSNLARYTPYFVGALYAIFIAIETPLSGMSMNPARTLGSAFPAGYWQALWIYFLAPTFGMLVAAEFFLRARQGVGPFCAKLHHDNNKRCIFQHGCEQIRMFSPTIRNGALVLFR